jgi:cysteine desulfurase / selenocysteine lyase
MTDHRQKDILSEEEFEKARSLFPYLKKGKLYLNHASTAPFSTRVVSAITQHLEARSNGDIETYFHDMDMVKELRLLVSQLVNAESPERISFQLNTSDALNVIAAGLTWHSGDHVILNTLEFPANIYPYLNLRKEGVTLDFLPSADGRITVEMVERALTPRTRLVAISAVQFLSGHRTDLAAMSDLCKSRGVYFVVDAIQAIGAVNIDVRALKIDALAAGAQKWQLAPQGTAFLYLTEEFQSLITPPYLGWLAVDDPWQFHNYDQPLAAGARRFEGGTLNFTGLWGMYAAHQMLHEFGMGLIESQILTLTDVLGEELRKLDGVRVVTPEAREERAGIVTAELPGHVNQTRLMERMEERAVTAALREGRLRFSPHFYNRVEEMRHAAAVTGECLR